MRSVSPSLRRALAVLLVGAAVAVCGNARGHSQSHFLATQRYQDVYYLPPADWLHVFSLGHREALADLIWLRSLIYFGDEMGHRGQVSNLHNYADAMLALDPYFKRVYTWASICSLYRTGSVGAEDARRAIAYLEKGVRLFPDDGDMAWTLGATYLYELPPLITDQKEIDEASRRGAEHMQAAVRLGAGPPWLVLSNAAELKKLGQREQLIAHLTEVYAQITDPDVKQQIEEQLSQLQSAAYAEAMRRTVAELEAARARDFPYVDRELYLLIGPRPAFDGRALLLRNFDPVPERFEASDAP